MQLYLISGKIKTGKDTCGKIFYKKNIKKSVKLLVFYR